MKKTSVYLSDDEDEALRQTASATGIARSDLIREGIRAVVGAHSPRPRTFHSMGKGRSGGGQAGRWSSEELHERRVGSHR